MQIAHVDQRSVNENEKNNCSTIMRDMPTNVHHLALALDLALLCVCLSLSLLAESGKVGKSEENTRS